VVDNTVAVISARSRRPDNAKVAVVKISGIRVSNWFHRKARLTQY
jgi:hypothetical protein